MKDEQGKVIYVGKAKNLRRRLCQYFQRTRQEGKIAALVSEIRQIDVILVHNELESLILENNLIKHYKPRYNILLVPDYSGYGYVVQTDELFPRLAPYRKNRINPALGRARPKEIEKRFGPYLTSDIRDSVMKCVVELCGLRACSSMPHKVCYLFDLKRCLGPCERYVTHEEYLEAVERAGRYLAAPHLNLVDHLTAQMNAAAEALEFERASHIRDQIKAIKSVFERQSVERDIDHDQEVIYLEGQNVIILRLVRGALMGLEWLPGVIAQQTLDTFLIQRYRSNHCPSEIICAALPDPEHVQETLIAATGQQMKVTIPLRGAAFDLLDIARLNCQYRAALAGV